jgi:hypothetical protein
MTPELGTIAKATSIIAAIDNHINSNCEHCKKLLLDWKEKSSKKQVFPRGGGHNEMTTVPSQIDTNFPITRIPEWSNSCLVDNLKQHLATIESSQSKVKTDLLDVTNDKFNTYFCLISNRHYLNQAFHYLKIGAYKNPPEFHVSLSDLSPKIINELASLDKDDREFVLKQAIGRIFEDINAKLYHNSISKVLKVGFFN